MKAIELKLGHPVLKNNKLVCVSLLDLSLIEDEEHNDENIKLYRPVTITEPLLKILNFEIKINPVNKNTYFTHTETGLKVVKFNSLNIYLLNYNLKEDSITYYPILMYFHQLLDAFYLLKQVGIKFDEEHLNLIQNVL